MCNPTKSKRQKTASSAASPSSTNKETAPSPARSSSLKPWPTANPCRDVQFPSSGLLHGLDDLVWNAMAHVKPPKQYFDTDKKRKGVAVREALRQIGMEWVAINTHSYRPAYGAKFDGAAKFYKGNRWRAPRRPLPEVRRVEIEDREWSAAALCDDEEGELHTINDNGTTYTNKAGELDFVIVKNGSKDSECLFPAAVAECINSSIQQTGMAVVRGAVDEATIEKLRFETTSEEGSHHSDATKIKEDDPCTRLLDTKGDGVAGEETLKRHTRDKPFSSYYSDIKDSTYLNRMQNIIVSSLNPDKTTSGEHGGEDGTIIKPKVSAKNESINDVRKYILLKYSKGAENWAHRDSNKNDGHFPYQALLMLSKSDEYDGGEFYVAKQQQQQHSSSDGEGIISVMRMSCPKLNAGDLVIFQATGDGDYSHGMKMVTRGERVAVGLLQPR